MQGKLTIRELNKSNRDGDVTLSRKVLIVDGSKVSSVMTFGDMAESIALFDKLLCSVETWETNRGTMAISSCISVKDNGDILLLDKNGVVDISM